MNKYSQLLKKLGLSAAALALSATLAVDSASAADENATDETVEQNVETDTTTEEKTEGLSEEEATFGTEQPRTKSTVFFEVISDGSTISEATQPEETQPEQTDRLYGRTPVPHVNYDHAYFTHKTSKTGNKEWSFGISFYINGNRQSEKSYYASSEGTGYYNSYDDLRDIVEETIKDYHAKGFILDKLDDNPYDGDHSYYFVDNESLLTNEEEKQTPVKEEAPEAKPEEQKPETGKQEEQKPAADKQEEQKPAASAKEKPAADKKEESFDDLRPLEELPLGGHASSFDKNGFPINWSEAKKQAYIEKFGLPKGADKQGSVQSDKQDSELVAKRKDLLARVEASDLTESAKKQLIEVINDLKLENVSGAETAFYHYQKRHYEEVERQKQAQDKQQQNDGQTQSQDKQQDGQKQEARGERLPDTATGAWALGAVGLSTILAGLGVKKFKKD
ncbi:hypothetical protein [Dolosigranulum pigrum]|uniref:hypothetical protein n=1 Tax=Dolosigranulum pigrum TaxID=29394 RepID=UPI001AD86815|nr:hypothetical protein [Dolosigranulum pigrum]QTJ42704.1 hypothetical protein FE327_01660 [Dolosigranulum pigrum]QTJ46104.1 hypothetical protein FE329_01695 [Dolosigranulum pigrum]QTJ59620.1 hypothetical protein FE337_01695 [Dolosigranulum pigrum]